MSHTVRVLSGHATFQFFKNWIFAWFSTIYCFKKYGFAFCKLQFTATLFVSLASYLFIKFWFSEIMKSRPVTYSNQNWTYRCPVHIKLPVPSNFKKNNHTRLHYTFQFSKNELCTVVSPDLAGRAICTRDRHRIPVRQQLRASRITCSFLTRTVS